MSATQPAPKTATDAVLSVNNIEVIYDHVILVLKGVSLTVPQGRHRVAARRQWRGQDDDAEGRSPTCCAPSAATSPRARSNSWASASRTLSPNELVRRGCIQVMEGRHCFGHLSIEENLLTGAFTRRDGRRAIASDLERIYELFPRLKQRRNLMAGYTSGGEQQMCAIGRAMMSKPSMILLDEPSMGLAPQIVEEIFEIVRMLNQSEGVSFLVAEQNANIALRYATYGYIMENGRIVLDGEAKSLQENQDVKEFYLGVAGDDRKSFQGRQALQAAQTLAGVSLRTTKFPEAGMSDYYDRLETRAPEAREKALFRDLRAR